MSHRRIHQLSAALANQIAAGEVIERPASVVKELLENALDAQATSIVIDINYGGLNHIKVSDNGSGILSEDLLLAIAPHATSKIADLDDLYSISSMGFRGEALASIASISRLTIASKPRIQSIGMKLDFVEGQITLLPCARAPGTTIEVYDIFFNAPIRKKFLKSQLSEFKAIEHCVKRFALGAHHIDITLIHNEKTCLQLKPALDNNLKLERLTKIFGRSFVQQAITVQANENSLSLVGWISHVEYQRNQNDKIWVYINGRIIRDKLVSRAIKVAYEDLLYPDKYPACLLYLTINPADIDVNVHPTKHEVRFQQPRLIHDFIRFSVRQCLLNESLDSSFKRIEKNINNKVSEPVLSYPDHLLRQSSFTSQSAKITVLNQSFALILLEEEFFLIDVVNFHKEWLCQKLKKNNLPLLNRPLLVPVSIELPSCSEEYLGEKQQLLAQLGITIEFNGRAILVRTIPIEIPELNIKAFLNQFLSHSSPPSLDRGLLDMVNNQTFDAFQLDDYYCQEYCIRLKQGTSAFHTQITEENCRALLTN